MLFMKKKIISVIVGVAGLAAAYFVVSGISHIVYNRPVDNAATESTAETTEQGTEEAKVAMTEAAWTALIAYPCPKVVV